MSSSAYAPLLSVETLHLSAGRARLQQHERVVGVVYRRPAPGGSPQPSRQPSVNTDAGGRDSRSARSTTTASSRLDPTSPAAPAFAVPDAEFILASVSTARNETTLETLQVFFDQRTTGLRQPLMALVGARDIVHVSMSGTGPHEETLLCITERIFSAAPSASSILAPTVGDGGSTSTSGGGNFNTRASTLPETADRYKLTLMAVGHHEPFDLTVVDTERMSSAHAALHSVHVCQRGYFLRARKDRSPILLLLAVDRYRLALLRAEFKGVRGRPGRLEVREVGEGIAMRHLWHHWCPVTQRVAYWVYRSTFELRVVDLSSGEPQVLLQLSDEDRMFDAVAVSPPPVGAPPMAVGCASLTSAFHASKIPIEYESGATDVALFFQRLHPSFAPMSSALSDVSGGVQAAPSRPTLTFTVTMLHNYLLMIRFSATVDPESLPRNVSYRATVFFVSGVLCILIPGVMIHFVDVSHSDSPPRYLFGFNLYTIRARSAASSPIEAVLDPLSSVGGGGAGSGGSGSLTNSASRGVVLQMQDRHPYIPAPLNAILQGSGAVFVPVIGGTGTQSTWLLSAGGTTLYRISLSRPGLWRWVRENTKLGYAQINNVIHIATTHFSEEGRAADSAVACVGAMLAHDHTSLRSGHLAQMFLGAAYDAVREACSELGNRYWPLVPMADSSSGALEDNSAALRYGGIVLSTSQPDRSRVMLAGKRTQESWWLPASTTRRKTSVFQNIFGNKNAADMSRPITGERMVLTGTTVRGSPETAYTDALLSMLKRLGVPSSEATDIATLYAEAISRHVRALLDPSGPCQHRSDREELFFLHSIKAALLHLDYPPPPAFQRSYTELALQHLPAPVLLAGVKAQLYTPTIEELFNRFGPLQITANESARDYGCSPYLPLSSSEGSLVNGGVECPQASRQLSAHAEASVSPASAATTAVSATTSVGRGSGVRVGAAAVPSPTHLERAFSTAAAMSFDAEHDDEGMDEHTADTIDALIPYASPPHMHRLHLAARIAATTVSLPPEARHAIATAVDPASLLQLYRRNLPLNAPYGRYAPLNLFTHSTIARESAFIVPSLAEAAVRRERAKITMQEALYPMITTAGSASATGGHHHHGITRHPKLTSGTQLQSPAASPLFV